MFVFLISHFRSKLSQCGCTQRFILVFVYNAQNFSLWKLWKKSSVRRNKTFLVMFSSPFYYVRLTCRNELHWPEKITFFSSFSRDSQRLSNRYCTFESVLKEKYTFVVGLGPPVALCTILTILLTLWNCEQKNGLLIKLFYFSSDMKLGEIVEHMGTKYNSTKFHQNQMKNQKNLLLLGHYSVQNFQSVSRIVKIVHSAFLWAWKDLVI